MQILFKETLYKKLRTRAGGRERCNKRTKQYCVDLFAAYFQALVMQIAVKELIRN